MKKMQVLLALTTQTYGGEKHETGPYRQHILSANCCCELWKSL